MYFVVRNCNSKILSHLKIPQNIRIIGGVDSCLQNPKNSFLSDPNKSQLGQQPKIPFLPLPLVVHTVKHQSENYCRRRILT